MKPKKRWSRYQVDGERYSRPRGPESRHFTTTKSVAELTEAEAKDELCEAMDLIANMAGCSHRALEHARKQRYFV